MNLLHRHLLRELAVAALGAVALFAFVLLTGSAIRDIIGRAADGVIKVPTALQMLALLVPYVLSYALPMGLLAAVLLTLGRISAQNEVTAMRAAGIGFSRIGAPAMLLAVAGVALSLVVNFSYAPNARSAYRRILADVGRANPIALITERNFIRDFPGYVVYVGRRDGGTLRDIWIWEIDREHRVTKFLRAEEGTVEWNEDANFLLLVAHSARVDVREADAPEDFSGAPVSPYSGALTLQLPLDRLFRRTELREKPAWMNFRELTNERRRLLAAGAAVDRRRLLDVDMSIHEKAAMAFSVLSFTVVAVPLGIRTRRSETSANLGLALLLTMAFYLMMIIATWLDTRPELHPEMLLWIPNLVFQVFGLWLWRRLGQT